ncbi:uncharacterized protein si:dkeyp-97a10.2 [Dicentrarchus labrax]|uniref:uncharacterized protein si:dkeyp-97a10.2 n=1 Tax=Dicentrarchus labrax TaxID=13489 RepID=UPI0021F65B92|nr:uncharacterized protein si:dkeyp-97a10.2 [Dicentrarchus labrax]
MAKLPPLCMLLLFAGQVPALTATPVGLRVRQYPPSLSVMRGETATLSCHFKVESLKYGVQWFKMKSEKQLISKSSRQIVVEKDQTSSLVITEVALEDSGWYYCEVNVLQKDPEWGNGTELVVLAPPSAPRIYLQIPPDPQTGQWALLCITGGFHPSELTLTWTYQSTTADIDHLSVTNCTLSAINPHGNLSTQPDDKALLSSDWLMNSTPLNQPKCFQVIDNHSKEVYLFSVFFLPPKQSLDTGITFTCWVQDHPAMSMALTASFTWDASPNELIVHLNILKMCFLSAVIVVFLLKAGVMDLQCFLCWRVTLLLLLMPCGLQCMSVHILNEEPVYVIPGSKLVLNARIEVGPLESVFNVTWERESETGVDPKRVTLATCPNGSLKCDNTRPNVQMNVKQHETTLQINGYSNADRGVYAVTVMDHKGAKTTAHCIVRMYEAVHHVSVSINVSHSSLVCGEAWGTDPNFSWLYERVAITKTVGTVSNDGTTLFVTKTPICGHFTCMVSNKLGYSTATYTAAPCETEGRGTTAAVVCLVLLLLFGGVLAFLLWRRHRHNNRGERLHEHLDDTI